MLRFFGGSSNDPTFLPLQENTTQFHMPGYNYMGPGTHISNNIYSHVRPTNKNDYLSMLHDVDYITHGGYNEFIIKDDDFAIANTNYNLGGIILKTGLELRKNLLTSSFHSKSEGQWKYGKSLADSIMSDPEYINLAEQYEVPLTAWKTKNDLILHQYESDQLAVQENQRYVKELIDNGIRQPEQHVDAQGKA
jgi:hypothetical protein